MSKIAFQLFLCIPVFLGIWGMPVRAAGDAEVAFNTAEDFKTQFKGYARAETDDGCVYLIGCRWIDYEKSPGTTKRGLYRFDPQTRKAACIVPGEAFAKAVGRGGGEENLAVDPARAKAYFTEMNTHHDADGREWHCCDIHQVDLKSGSVRCLIADGKYNYNVSVSPDGRRLAYWSTDWGSVAERAPGAPVKEHAGCLYSLDSGEKRIVTDYFIMKGPALLDMGSTHFAPPSWLDAHRALFITMTSERSLMLAHGSAYPKNICRPYLCLFDVERNRARTFFPPLRLEDADRESPAIPQQLAIDRKRRRIYFCDYVTLYSADFDLEKVDSIKAVDPEKEGISRLRMEGDELKYAIKPRR